MICSVAHAGQPLQRTSANRDLGPGATFFKKAGKQAVVRGESGKENRNAPPPFDFQRAEEVAAKADAVLLAGSFAGNEELRSNIESSLAELRILIEDQRGISDLASDQIISLMDSQYEVENLCGLAEKGTRELKSLRFVAFGKDGKPDFSGETAFGDGGASKVNTGWILDQKVYDPSVEKTYPTIPVDIRSHDEGASDIEVDDDGWMWEVQSFFFSDTTNIPDHLNPSYCLAVYLSPDGGTTWYLYEVLYDPAGKDIINPRLAVDILPSENRFYIAYEYAYSASDHDIFVYSESFSAIPAAQDAPVAASALMERNPDIASDYQNGQTPYKVVAFEKEASAGSYNYDICASQCFSDAGQLLVNPGFESGNVSWNASNANIISTGQARSGTYAAKMGTTSSITDTIYQDIAVPIGPPASLTLWLKIISAETTTTTVYDTFALQVRDTSNNVLATLLSLSNLNKAAYAAYTNLSYDLSAYGGQTIRLALTATNDSALVTSFYADDMALNISPGPAWSAPSTVAADASSERNPALSNGASGNSTFTQYMHLAYNYDSFSTAQALLNNGFESGNDGRWTVNSSGDINCGGGYQRTGTCCAWLAGINSYTDFIYQDVAVPADAVSVNLSFYLKISSAEGTTTAYDFLYVQLRDTANNVLATLQTLSNKDKTAYSTYQPLTFNILPYAGQTVRVYFLATTNSTNITSFFLDDTAVNITTPSGYEVRYAKAQHPGSTSYPAGLASASKLTVLSNIGIGWEYGPPAVVATHGGGSSTWVQGRVAVAADQHFPADQPAAGDLERHQICFAWNMCNGSSTCGTMTCGADTLSKNWQENWFYDGRGDERYPSLIQDGAGLQTSGLDLHPFIYMAYFHRAADSPSELGEVQMILSDPSDETCDGFIYAYWYYFTASYTISDPDNLVSPVPRTINAFNYWGLSYAGAGATFNKEISHVSGGANDDIFCTTLGDNYSFYSYSNGDYLSLVISLDGVTYATKHTFAWASNYERDIIAVSPQEDGGYTYTFSNWSNGQTYPILKILSEYCDPVNPCPIVDFIATYSGCPTMTPPVIDGISNLDGSCSLMIVFTQGSPATQHDLYVDGGVTPVLTNISSPAYYSPPDGNSHNYVVRAVSGVCYADSLLYAQADPDCGAVSCVAPASEVIETVNTDKSGFKWTNISGADYYRVARGIQSNLAALLTSGTDFSCRSFGISDGATGFVFDGSDDSSGVSGRCYYYMIQGYDCEDPDSSYLGPPGNATAGVRQVELAAPCN